MKSHFDKSTFVDHTDFCIGARVAISKVKFLLEVVTTMDQLEQ